jgi:glycosyltransferase involved in cell wall biosynthesis
MKILFAVHQFFPNHYTGTERLTLNLAKQMQRMGHSVKVLTYALSETVGLRQDGDFLFKEYEFQGIPVVSIRHNNIPEDVGFTIFDLPMEKFIKKIIAFQDFDVVHVLHPMRIGTIIKMAKRSNIPIILSPTDFWLMCPKGIAVTQKGELCYSSENTEKCIRECYGELWRERLVNRYKQSIEVFKSASAIVSATNFLSKIFVMNNMASNIKIIGFGEDHCMLKRNNTIYSDNSEVTIGFLSTLLPHKGAHILLEAYNKAKIDSIKLRIFGHYFGDTEYYQTLKKMVNRLDKIEFCGEYQYEKMPEIFNKIDLLVVPSIWWENSPLVLLKALAHKIPAIVSDLGGLTEIIKDGENGFTFQAGNSDSLAQVLRKICSNPSALNKIKLKIKCPPRIEDTAFEYEKIYLYCCSQNK